MSARRLILRSAVVAALATPGVPRVAPAQNLEGSASAEIASEAATAGSAGSVTPSGATTSREDTEALELEREAEDAIRKGDYTRAKQALQMSLALPANRHTPRASELLGVVSEKTGQPAEARRIYTEYLARYPEGENSVRVRQRLDALTLQRPAAASLRAESATARAWHADLRGAFSSFYLRDRSRSDFVAAAAPAGTPATDRRDNVDELVSTADFTLSAVGPETRIDAHVDAAYVAEYRPVTLVGSDRQKGSYPMSYDRSLSVTNDGLGLSAHLGRQTRFGDGIFGRFDGALLGWRFLPRLKVNAFAGHPVFSPRDTGVDDTHHFRGASVEYTAPSDAWRLSGHWFDQSADGLVDRRSLGGQLRVDRSRLSLGAMLDYDVYFGRLNAAYLNTVFGFQDGSTLAVSGELAHYPILALTNAAIGQPVPAIEVVGETFDLAELERLALDRTMDSRSVTLTYSRSLGASFQLIGDASVSRTGDSPASAGVPAFPGSGSERFFGAQIIGSSLLKREDSWIFGLHRASLQFADVLLLEFTAKLPLTSRFSIAPRLQFVDTGQRTSAGARRDLRPSVRLFYAVGLHGQVDASFGESLIRQRLEGPTVFGRREETAFIGYVGYRIVF